MEVYRADLAERELALTESGKVTFILDTCANINSVTVKDIKTKGRKREIVYARHMARWFIHNYTSLSLKSNVRETSGINHTSALSSIRVVGDLVDTDRVYKNNFEQVLSIVEGRMKRVHKYKREDTKPKRATA